MAKQESYGISDIEQKSDLQIYEVKRIHRVDEIADCTLFHIDHFNWTRKYQPEAYGRMGLIENFGLIISLTVIETNPLRRYYQVDDPVYKDSAVEAFLNFLPGLDTGYFNFEMNANGALLSEFGPKKNRKRIKDITPYKAVCEASIEEAKWNVLLQIPMELICDLYPIKPLTKGDTFTCNFYKISEDPSYEHYASYSPVSCEVPNFHLPEFFCKALVI